MTTNRRHAFFAVFSLSLVLFAFAPLRRVVVFSLHGNTDSSHIILIPFITAALLYSRRQMVFKNLQTSVFPAAVMFVAGAVLNYLGRTYAQGLGESNYLGLMTGSIIVIWLSGFLAFYGTSAFKGGLFPLLFLCLAIPIPSRVFHETARFLQHGSAEMVSMLFSLTGTPTYRDNFVFTLPGLTIEVAEECSGIRSTLGIFIVTLLASNLLLKSNWKRAALLLIAIPISLFKNAVRIATLSLLAIHWDMGFITGRLHSEGGIVFMMIGLGLLYPFLALMIRAEAKQFAIGVRS